MCGCGRDFSRASGKGGERRAGEAVQLQLDTKKTCIMALLALFAFSSLGFAVFGLIMGPDHRIGLERRSEVEVEIRRPQVPDLEEFVQVWHGAGSVSYTHLDVYKRQET